MTMSFHLKQPAQRASRIGGLLSISFLMLISSCNEDSRSDKHRSQIDELQQVRIKALEETFIASLGPFSYYASKSDSIDQKLLQPWLDSAESIYESSSRILAVIDFMQGNGAKTKTPISSSEVQEEMDRFLNDMTVFLGEREDLRLSNLKQLLATAQDKDDSRRNEILVSEIKESILVNSIFLLQKLEGKMPIPCVCKNGSVTVSSVKYNLARLFPASDGLEAYHGLDRYFDYYNHTRRHQSLGYQTPEHVYQQPLCKAA